MARYRRYRRTIVRAPKKKWATNIVNFNNTTAGTNTQQYAAIQLVTNSVQASSPTPVIVKAGNFKIQGDVYVVPGASGAQTEVSLYVMYIPEGINLNSVDTAKNIILAHPEWIMAWKFVNANRASTTATDNSESFSFTSRLKRNLNSGDSIYLLCMALSSNMSSSVFAGMAQYWTCAN